MFALKGIEKLLVIDIYTEIVFCLLKIHRQGPGIYYVRRKGCGWQTDFAEYINSFLDLISRL